MKTALSPLLLLLLCAAGAAASAAESVVYTSTGGESLTLEGAARQNGGPHPAVLLLGIRELAPAAASAGYAAFTLTHRPEFPGAVDDVRRAVRYVRFHASRWNVDPRRIALVGYSREGVLGSLGGLMAVSGAGGSPRRQGDAADRASDAVQAVVAIAAASDFRQPGFAHSEPEEWSPVLHIRGGGVPPPFLLIHGDSDTEVPLTQSAHFQNALQAAGFKCNLMIVPGGGHSPAGWNGARNWMQEMFGWLAQVVGRERRSGTQ